FCHQFNGEKVEARGIAARLIEARHKAELDRVTGHAEGDRDSCGRSLGRECGGGGARGDHAHSTANEIGRQRSGRRSYWPSAHRYSIPTLCPSTYPPPARPPPNSATTPL